MFFFVSAPLFEVKGDEYFLGGGFIYEVYKLPDERALQNWSRLYGDADL